MSMLLNYINTKLLCFKLSVAVAILVRNMRNQYVLTNISINFPKELEDLKNKSSGTCMLGLI